MIDWAFGGEHSGRHGSKSSGDNQTQQVQSNLHQKATGRHDESGEAVVNDGDGEIAEASPGTSYDSPANQNQASTTNIGESQEGGCTSYNAAGTCICVGLVRT